MPLGDTHWFSAGCQDCSRIGAVSVPAAVRLLGGGATVGDLARRLRCTGCGGRRVVVHIAVDSRTAETQRREGPLPEVSAGLPSDTDE